MRQQKPKWCILLTLTMMASLLVITHVPAFAADGDIVNGSEPKWVEAQVTGQGEYCFDAQNENGLYDNFVFCLVDSDKTPPALDDFHDAQVVLSRSEEMCMTGIGPNAKNDHNCYHLDEIDASAGTMTGDWETDNTLVDECVYVKADSVFGIDADLWAFTWMDDAYLTEHGAVLPTYTDGIYHSGTNQDQTSLITDSIALTRSTATKAAAAAAHGTDTAGLSADVMGVYKSLTPEQRSMTGTEEYRQCFQSLNSVSGAGQAHETLTNILHNYATGEARITACVFDGESGIFICLADSYLEEPLYPGEWRFIS